MAMKPCKECNQEISSNAKQCPHCGVSNPTVTAGQTALTWVFVIIGGWFLISILGDSDEDMERARNADLNCRQTLQCWGDKHDYMAGALCKPMIERLAKYSHQWTDGTLEPKFSHFRWQNPEQSIITVMGDRIKFQNGLGAYQNMSYECDYDPINEKILDVRITEGYLE